jgi:hypothetical protein
MRTSHPVKATHQPAVVDSGGLNAHQIRRLAAQKCGGQADFVPPHQAVYPWAFCESCLPGVFILPRTAERKSYETTEVRII